jgi:hypothetical protein
MAGLETPSRIRLDQLFEARIDLHRVQLRKIPTQPRPCASRTSPLRGRLHYISSSGEILGLVKRQPPM